MVEVLHRETTVVRILEQTLVHLEVVVILAEVVLRVAKLLQDLAEVVLRVVVTAEVVLREAEVVQVDVLLAAVTAVVDHQAEAVVEVDRVEVQADVLLAEDIKQN